ETPIRTVRGVAARALEPLGQINLAGYDGAGRERLPPLETGSAHLNSPAVPRNYPVYFYFVLRALGCLALLAACCGGELLAAGDISFTADVVPVLTRFGCNAGACHGKLSGQNGFHLSLRGYDPAADYESLAREARGRRINLAAPEHSLFVRKALGELPHGGGRRIEPGSRAEQVLVSWL